MGLRSRHPRKVTEMTLLSLTIALLTLAATILWPRIVESLAGCLAVLVVFIVSSAVTVISIISALWPAK